MSTKLITGLSLAVLLAVSPAIAADKAEKKPAEAAATTKAPEAKPAETKAKPADEKAKAPATNADWANLPIENKKGEKLGTVVEAVPATGKVKEIHAKIGEDTVKISAKKAKKEQGKVVVSLTAEQLKKLPKVKK